MRANVGGTRAGWWGAVGGIVTLSAQMAAHRPRVSSGSPRLASHRFVPIDSTTSLELDAPLQFLRALWVAVHALQKASKRMTRTLGVTGPQRFVIRVVGLSPGISAGALARALHLHPSTVTGVLQRLEIQGLVRRDRHADDGRRAVLRLTPAGERLNVALTGTVEAAARVVLSGASAAEQRATRDLLERMARQLDADAVAQPPAQTVRPLRDREDPRPAPRRRP
jgi:MarR family transcriptional regulator, organic hydroperoxide resistance regulator